MLEAERAQLPPWIAVGLGAGIAAWFVLTSVVGWWAFLCITAAIALAGFVLVPGRLGRALGAFAAVAAFGCALVWLRAESVAAPRLERPKVVETTAEIERVERLMAKGTVRLTVAPDDPELPSRVRVTFKTEGMPGGLGNGARIRFRARLAPPPAMALPGSYDFSRDAWFKGIGAVGRGLGPPTIERAVAPSGFAGARDSLREQVTERLPGPSGGIAIALATGDQNAVALDDAEAMRRSGLTHLLSVSGLHIAAVVAFAMLISLKLLALSERLALRLNLVLVSAGFGAAAGIGYTLLTGSQVPTVRSCIAALLVLAGIALGRDALSMRLIATGAILVLLFRPESLAGASFQMSFAAVTAIVALHSSRWARRTLQRREEGFAPRAGRALASMVLTGLAVECALIPLSLYHFHRTGLYGVAANMIAIPLTTFVIMPLEAAALALDSIGLGKPVWILCGWSIDGLLGLARMVSEAKGAVAMLPTVPNWSFGMIIGGGLWLCLWNTRIRLAGIIPCLAGAAGALTAATPDVLITNDGRHLAIVGPEGQPMVLRERAGGFVRTVFAESAGFDGDAPALADHPNATCSRDSCWVDVEKEGGWWRLLATRSNQRIDWTPLTQACAVSDIVVSERWLPDGCKPRWLKLDRNTLRKTGSIALYLGQEVRIDTAASRIGEHPWAQPPISDRRRPVLNRETVDAPIRH